MNRKHTSCIHSKVLQCWSPPQVNMWPSLSAGAQTWLLGSEAAVLPAQMHCTSRNSPEQVVVIMRVNCCFSSFPKPSTCFNPCGAQVYLLRGIGLRLVWSPFRIVSIGVFHITTWYVMCRNASSHWFSQSTSVFWAACVTVWWDHPNSSCRNQYMKWSEHLKWLSARTSGANISRWPWINAQVIVCNIGKPPVQFAKRSFLMHFTICG